MALKDRLREARKNAGMSQEQLASMVGIAKSTLSGYERDGREPSMFTLSKIMTALGVDANFLLQDEMRDFQQAEHLSSEEKEHIKKFRCLDGHGKKIVTIVTDEEYARCAEDEASNKVVELTLDRGSGQLVARNGRDLSPSDKEKILSITRRWREEHPEG
ncbi:MAG: helix-turn-helix transcriptional regulator [Blautia sp.]|nr:helix-turn-helix transcriptional regulator [Blautia sp.]